jgi:hypothetical protein
MIRLDPGFAARVLSHRLMGQNLGDHLALRFGPKAGSGLSPPKENSCDVEGSLFSKRSTKLAIHQSFQSYA